MPDLTVGGGVVDSLVQTPILREPPSQQMSFSPGLQEVIQVNSGILGGECQIAYEGRDSTGVPL